MIAEPITTNQTEQKTANPGMVWIKLYGVVYLLLFAAYVAYSLTGGVAVKPSDFVQSAFATLPAGASDLKALHSNFNATQGHILLWEPLIISGGPVERRIPADERLTEDESVALAHAILTAKDVATTVSPIVVNRYGFTQHHWAYLMTVYNVTGLFLVIIVFLRKPLTGMLDTKAQQTASALKAAREAQSVAEELRRTYEELLREVEEKKEKLAQKAEGELMEEREHILKAARHDAKTMLETLQSNLGTEVHAAREKLRAEVAKEALALAREMLKDTVNDDDHTEAVESFLKDLDKVDFS